MLFRMSYSFSKQEIADMCINKKLIIKLGIFTSFIHFYRSYLNKYKEYW